MTDYMTADTALPPYYISLTAAVAYGVIKGQRKYLPLAILAHAGVDLLPALYQRGTVFRPNGKAERFRCRPKICVTCLICRCTA